ncbi:hypothetical protein [Deinococcus radiophilus]|nr:hypothetical protein [Deinococcus radiophilus]
MLISGVGSGTLTGTPLDQPPSTPAQVLLVPKKGGKPVAPGSTAGCCGSGWGKVAIW